MDAVKFVEGYGQMCDYYSHCYACPLNPLKNEPCALTNIGNSETVKTVVAIVEKWVEEHPEEMTTQTASCTFTRMVNNVCIN